ncbi:potassium voltage-gated channel subfamily V member 1 isoform X1 [Lepisosteus oculatus]|nr:PREDICTED: potassium voltage-gated channel subfamily V member 1 isoform X1 [Lepisosteus oculatus]XP_015212815.1 PREDICTED: potassium voltage-gated channel subfamily V member 1 isoform X1 [Lepisosteus oculatus]XP_015212816.1 PREDICTED: potassium voltage-gated channel subfamily V member 1 isoform X1 [Lepisosteus oculatus]
MMSVFLPDRFFSEFGTMTSCSSSPAEFCGNSVSLLSLDSSVFFSEPPPNENPLDFFIINVGGSRYVLSQELLSSYPETRLGKLALSARDSVLDLCDDANFVENEFFFDRNSQTFKYIMHYYKTGHLHVMEELCAVSFLQEIEYWGIDELNIDSCCRDKYYRRKEMKETLDVRKDPEVIDTEEEDFSGVICENLRQKLWDVMEKPESSVAAKTFGTLSVFFVFISIVNMALISLDFSSLEPPFLDVLEYICIAWFTGEFVLRFMCVKDKCKFSRSVVNIIDLIAILPFYVTLVVENLHGGSTELENVGRVVQVLRLMRSLRMLKLGRHSTGLKSLGMTIAQCYEEVGLLLLFLSVGISIFSTIEYAVEHNIPDTTFTSVPCAWWWATTSMTTVGYGDIRPDTTVGKIIAFLCILSGILILALPIAIINDRFSACYFTLKMKEAALRHREALKKLTKNSTTDVAVNINLRDVYARSIMEMLRLRGRERASTRSSGGDDLWW